MITRDFPGARKLFDRYCLFRGWVYNLVTPYKGGNVGRLIDLGIMCVIAINVIAVILSTVDSVYTPYSNIFYWVELGSVVIFTLEYISRVWSAVEDQAWNGIVTGRLKFALQPLLIIDLLAILPFYILAAGTGIDLRVLRSLRLIRVLRMFKIARYSESLRAFKRVFQRKYPDLVVALFANVLLLIVASSAMYFIETRVQPDAFSSIPTTMLWGVSALTEVDLGGAQPVTPLGQVLGAIVAALGIGLFALPASILASGFINEAGSNTGTEVTYCPHCGEKVKTKTDEPKEMKHHK